jgi:hypothetical protein
MKSNKKWLLALLFLPCLPLGCASGEPADPAALDEEVGESSLAIQPEDRNLCCFPQIDDAPACNARDGVHELHDGVCTIFVEQQCQLVQAPNGEVGCCCKIEVLDTMAGCNNKDFEDFYPKCKN